MGAKYPGVTVSGYSASAPPDDGTVSDANKVKYSTLKTKLGDPLNVAIAAQNTALVAAFDYSVNQKTAAYTTVAADHMRTVEVAPSVSSAVTISLGDASAMTNNYMVRVKNSGSAAVTVGRATSGNTIDGVAGNLTLAAGQAIWLATNSGADGYITLAGLNYSPGSHTAVGSVRSSLTSNSAGNVGFYLTNVGLRENSSGELCFDVFTSGWAEIAHLITTGGLQINNGSAPGVPTGGGIIYVESGALKYKGSSGTVTVLGAA